MNDRLPRLATALTVPPVLLGPWLFGAWEMWWFWPLAVCAFAAALLAGMALLGGDRTPAAAGLRSAHRGSVLLLALAPFLLYAFVRSLQADVWMTAERSLLLFLLPVLLGGVWLLVAPRGFAERLEGWVYANLILLGVYGVANHLWTGSRYVLWAPGEAGYIEQHRATGSYFCPDHFAGVMEILFAVALARLCARGATGRVRTGAALALVLAVAGVLLSKSRGGGLTLVVVALGAAWFGFAAWPGRWRWCLRAVALAGVAAAIVAVVRVPNRYMDRMRDYPWRAVENSSRYQMYAAAWRIWQTAPWFGVGPGMHQHLWLGEAASPDGDRAAGVWPTRPNYDWHSYEVHSDWLQVLEEYGAIGLLLLLLATGAVATTLWCGVRRGSVADTAPPAHYALGAGLALLAMAFHSLGDFNLQMPATGWILAAVICAGLAGPVRGVSA